MVISPSLCLTGESDRVLRNTWSCELLSPWPCSHSTGPVRTGPRVETGPEHDSARDPHAPRDLSAGEEKERVLLQGPQALQKARLKQEGIKAAGCDLEGFANCTFSCLRQFECVCVCVWRRGPQGSSMVLTVIVAKLLCPMKFSDGCACVYVW